jgi:electron transfer flavoprotein alpha subunit
MSILIYAESENGKLKKNAFELASYASKIAEANQDQVIAVTINAENLETLGTYGVNKVLNVQDDNLKKFNVDLYSDAVSNAAKESDANLVIISQSANAKYLAPVLSINLEAGYASNVVELPDTSDGFKVKRSVFTNKAFGLAEITTETKIVGLSNNAFGLHENPVECAVVDFSPAVSASGIEVQSVDKNTDKVSIADAEIVVSGGRGLKGPENWHLIEDQMHC